jgi:prevent-host-death family protein
MVQRRAPGSPRCETRGIVTTVDIKHFQECVSELVDRAEQGEAITVMRHGRPVAQLVPAAPPMHPPAITTKGAMRPDNHPRYLPSPIKLRGSGPSAVDYVTESRR